MKAHHLMLVLSLAAPAAAAPSLEPPETAPVEGRTTGLSFSDEAGDPAPGLVITAVYRENAHASLRREQAVGTTDAAGRVDWTPEQAGVVVLQWEGGSRNVSVVHDGLPPAALLVALLAGLALLGGSVAFFAQMLRQPKPEILDEVEEIGEPPST
jgi:hypothetical protein